MEKEGQIGGLEVDEQRLAGGRPGRLYLFMLEEYPYMMTPSRGLLSPAPPARRSASSWDAGDAGMPHRYPLARAEAGTAQLPLQGSPC